MENKKKKPKKTAKKTAKRARKPNPTVLAINICDGVIRDEATKKVSLIGLFSVIRAPGFPIVHPLMHVYVALTNGHGDYAMTIRFCDDKGQDLARMEGPIQFENPLQVIELNLAWQQLRIKHAGEYTVEVWCNKVRIGERRFRVVGPQKPNLTSGTQRK